MKKIVVLLTAAFAMNGCATNKTAQDRDNPNVGGEVEEKARIELNKGTIFLRIEADFNLGKDSATFYYSVDNVKWSTIGTVFKMKFDYRRLFM